MKRVFLSLLFFQFCIFPVLVKGSTMRSDGNTAFYTDGFHITGVIHNTGVNECLREPIDPEENIHRSCHADFHMLQLSDDKYIFEDLSWSDSHIVAREWNFGDAGSGVKNVSHQKNPVHLFSGPGIYNVSLTIFSQSHCRDSVTKNMTILGTNVTVVVYGQVLNSSTGDPIAGQPVTVNINTIQYSSINLTNSNGIYQDTIPGVPAGVPVIISVFDCNDSLNIRTVYSSSVPAEANFSICAPAPCKAAFSYSLDTNNQVQNTYYFTDSSEGHPNHWLWSFGDGEESTEQNPVHSFTYPGQFNVCLTIFKKDLHGETICTDSSCTTVTTPSNYNLGGLLFAGRYPINNPSSTGDTGIACLYRIYNNKLIPVDTATFTYLGYFAFLHLMEGEYVVKASLKQGSSNFRKYIPAYTGDALKWQDAHRISLAGGNVFDSDIHLAPGSSIAGTGTIGGYVTHREKSMLVGDAEVILFDANQQPAGFSCSDASGRFIFNDLVFGKYFLYVEITGKYSMLKEIDLTEDAPVIDGIILEVSDQDFTGIAPPGNPESSVIIFPNPFSEKFSIIFSSEYSGRITIDIFSDAGMKVFTDSFFAGANQKSFAVFPGDLPDGLYFLTIRSDDGTIYASRKIIRH
jgi:PKD repeat protein